MTHAFWIFVTGLNWVLISYMLLSKGLTLLQAHTAQNTTLMWTVSAMLIGYLKGRFVLSKTVVRITNWIQSQSSFHISTLYPKSYFILLAVMASFGMAARFIPPDIRGFIDVAVGFALAYGSILYFKNSYLLFANKAK